MGKKNSESSKYREWERERRERLNVSFNDLGSLLPNHDPAISTSKVDILQKSAAYIRDLKKENSDLLLGGANKLQTKKIKRLQRYVEALLLRVQQLAKLLRDAGITLPPEPPTISPLGEKIPRWSNKISPKEAEKALEAEKISKSTSQKKAKVAKKELNSSSDKDGSPTKSSVKYDNPSSLAKSSVAAETLLSGNKLRSSPQKTDKESSKIPLPNADRRPQENGASLPVGQLFGDPSHILTSLPPHVVASDQQPGIIVIRTTGASTLGAVTQHPPQSTCFVIDNGNCGSVSNGQPSAIVASHPPTLEPRPTFVLASNGSLLPVLPASQFVAQPRQLIVSTSSPVSATNQSLAPITFSSSASNSQCIKPLSHPLREVKCSQPISGDLSQLKKVPIPALPRNKQKPHSSGKEGTEAAGKTVAKKKSVSVIGETAKTSKGAQLKNVEKKNSKLPTDNSPQEKSATVAPPIDVPPLSNNITTSAQEESLQEKQENVVHLTSKPLTNDSCGDSRKRELPEVSGDESVNAKRRKSEDTGRNDDCVPSARSDELSNGVSSDPISDVGPMCNSELISNTTCSLNGSASSYSIDALCKMNEKINVGNGVGSIKDSISARKQKFSPGEISSQNDTKDQAVESSGHSASNISVTSAVSENSLKSVSNGDAVGIHSEERVHNEGNKSTDLSSKDGRENYLPVYSSSEHSSHQDTESNIVDSQNIISPCSLDTIPHNDEESSTRNMKDNTLSGSEHKGKCDSQSSILPTFGSSPSFPHAEDSYRKENVGRESNCGTNPMDESSLPPGAFSSDLFASLQVPSGHSESISPTAAFLLAFPLVSTLTGKTPDLGSDNHHSQTLTSLENGNGDNDLSSGGCGSSFLQLGNLEDNSPSSSSQSILSSLTSSNASSQSTILHLKSANTIHSLMPRSVEHDYGRESIETDIQLVERQVTSSKDISLKGVASKDSPYVPPLSSTESSEERHAIERNSHKEMNPSAVKIESMSLKPHSSKENENERIAALNGNIPARERSNMSNIGHASQNQKSPHQDNQVANICAQSNGKPITSASDKSNVNPCQNQQFEVDNRTENNKKDGSDSRLFSSSDQQYVSYQLPHISCGSTDLPEPLSTSASITHSTEDSTSNRVLRQEIQTLSHTPSTSNLHQNQANLTFQHIDHTYKSETRPLNGSKEIQNRESNYSNGYSLQNPSASIPPPVSSTNCFSISSFTTSFPSTISNSLLSSCIVTNSSPSFSSANSAPLLMTSSSYSTSSVTYPPHSNTLYSNSSSSCVTPIYSSSLTPALCSSTPSFPNSSFSAMPASVTSATPVSRTAESSKTSVPSSVAISAAHPNTYPNHQSNVIPNLLPSSAFSNSVSTTLYDSSQKENSQPVSSSQQQNGHPLKDSGAEHKGHNHGTSSNMHCHVSEATKSHNIFSVDQLNNQNYCYNFNDYSSHMPSYMPQKPDLEMMTKKSSAASSETHGGNLTSRMPGSFSVAHNSSNFSILSWTTLSPMSAAPSSSLDPQANNMNVKVDTYSSSPGSLGLSSVENVPPLNGKVSDANTSSFAQSAMPESRDIPNAYSQYPVGNNNMGAEMNGLTSFPMPQDVSKQTSSRGQTLKPRQQVTNWMTTPDPIHSSSDFAHSSDVVSSDHVRDAFGSNAATYNSNAGFYTHHNQSEMPYVSSSNSSIGSNAILDRRSGAQSIAPGTNGNSHKSCPNISEPSRSLGENILHLQPKTSDAQQNQITSCAYNKMTNSSTNYIHSSQSDLPALPTLVGDLALGSCNSIKGFLPIYDEANSSTSKPGKQDNGKVQSSHSNAVGCGNVIPAKENRDGRNTSSSHEYGGSSFLSVSQLVDHVKDSSHQSQPRENDRSGGEKVRNRDANKTTPASRRNVRQSNVKRDAAVTSKEQESSQMYHSRIASHSSQTFTNQGISPSIVSSNPTHLHAPPIPFPPYKSVHWPVNEMTKVADNSRNTANYKSSSSYSAEALIRPSLTTVALDSRLPDVEMSAYGMDIHKYSIPGGRSDHLFTDFVESNVIGSNMENVSLPQNHLKQNAQDHREANDNFRSGHHSNCDKFNYSTNTASTTFHTHHHHSHIPPSFVNNDDYSIESGNHASSLGLSSNCMDFAPFSHSKESGPITSSMSNVCATIGYSSPSNVSVNINQNQSHSCRSQEGKVSMRATGGNCEKTCSSSSSAMQVGSSKPDCSAEGGAKQVAKDNGVSHNSRSIPPFLPMEPSSSSYIGHHYPPHNHRHHNPNTQYPSAHVMDASSITPLNDSEHQAPKLFPRFPAPAAGVNHLPHQSSATSSSMGSGVGSSSHLSSGTLTNFNLSTIFPEINDKQTHHNHITPSTSSFETSTKNSKLCTVTSAAPILHPPSPLSTSYHHYRPHQHNHQAFPSSVDLDSRLPPPHPPSGVLHSNVSFNNLMVQSTPQVNGIGINSPLQPPPPPFTAPSFSNVLPGL